MGHSRLNTALLAIISCLLWSTAFAGVKIGLEYASPLQFAGTRFFIAGVIVFPLAYRVNSGYFRIIRDNLKMIPPLVISSSSMMLGGAALFVFSIPLEGIHFEAKPPVYFISLIWLSLLSAIAISIWITLLKRPGIKVSDLNLWKFLIPLFGALFSWTVLPAEQPQPLTTAGMFIITLALVISGLLKRKKHNFIRSLLP